MKYFQYVSDLHLEKSFKSIIPRAPYLLLAGDIAPLYSSYSKLFFDEYSKRFEKIFYVFGNHEYDCKKKYFGDKSYFPKNTICLENDIYIFKDLNVIILGSTLWTHSTNPLKYKQSVEFLSEILNDPKYYSFKIVCLTHHLPSYSLIIEKYENHPKKDRFANNLEFLMDPLRTKNPPTIWVCGHSHSKVEKNIFQTNCYINCYTTHITKFVV